MAIIDGAPRAGLIERARNILLHPSAEWDRIDAEPATVGGLFTGYAMILAAIPAVCSAIGGIVFGYGIPGLVSYHPSVVSALTQGVLSYLLTLASVFLMGLIIDALAPSFGGQRNRIKAMQVAVYSYTASWLAGAFGLVSMLAILGIVGLYSFYLLWRGLPRLMKAPEDKTLSYVAVLVVAGIVMALVMGAVLAPLRFAGMTSGLKSGGPAGRVSMGGATVDTAKLAAASRQLEASAAAMQAQAGQGAEVSGAPPGIAPDALKALLPATLNGFNRTELSAESAGTGGVQTSHAEAHYTRGASILRVKVSDTGAMAGLAGLASALKLNRTRETADGYEKVATVDGRLTTEAYDRTSRHGKYSVLAGGRLMVEAKGENVGVDELKAAVDAVGLPRVEALAKR